MYPNAYLANVSDLRTMTKITTDPNKNNKYLFKCTIQIKFTEGTKLCLQQINFYQIQLINLSNLAEVMPS